MPVVLETRRLVLRLPRDDDVDGLVPIFSDPEVVRWLGGRTRTRDDLAGSVGRWLLHWEEYGIGHVVLERKDDGRLVGRVGFLVWDPRTWRHVLDAPPADELETELGWTVGREHWRRGYATEAAVALRDWALGERGLDRLISLIRPENAASIRVAEKIGERFEREIAVGGHRTYLYSLRRNSIQLDETPKPSDS